MAVTGTPIQNKIEDVWALFRFLRLYPVAEKHAFNTWINTPCKTGDPTGLARLQLLMGCCSIRRTKESRDERGKRILELPPRHEIQQWLDLDPDERAVYEERRERGRDMVKDLKEKEESGEKGSTSMANVLHEILILRQTCNHIDLVDTGVIEEDFDGTVMEYGLAKQGIEKHGFNPARAISMVVYLKEGSGACCHECGGDIGDYFPSLGLGGVEEPESETADVKAKKKIPWKPILTKCEHIYCKLPRFLLYPADKQAQSASKVQSMQIGRPKRPRPRLLDSALVARCSSYPTMSPRSCHLARTTRSSSPSRQPPSSARSTLDLQGSP